MFVPPLNRDRKCLAQTWFLACQALNTTLITTLLFQDDTQSSSVLSNASLILQLTSPTPRLYAYFDQCIALYDGDSPAQREARRRALEARRVFGGPEDLLEVSMTGLQIALTSACVANDAIMRQAWRDLEPYATRKRRYQWKKDMKDEVEKGRREAVAEIIVATPPTLIDHAWGCNSTSLHIASFFGETSLCLALIARGADFTRVNDRGFTPSDCALKVGRTDTHSMLKMFEASKSITRPVVMKQSISTATKRGLDEVVGTVDEKAGETETVAEEERAHHRQCRQRLMMEVCKCSEKSPTLTEEEEVMDMDASESPVGRSRSTSTVCSYSSIASDVSTMSFASEFHAIGEPTPPDGDEDSVSPFDKLSIGMAQSQTTISSTIAPLTKTFSVPASFDISSTTIAPSSSSLSSSSGSSPATPPSEQSQDVVMIVRQAIAVVECGQKEQVSKVQRAVQDERIRGGEEDLDILRL